MAITIVRNRIKRAKKHRRRRLLTKGYNVSRKLNLLRTALGNQINLFRLLE